MRIRQSVIEKKSSPFTITTTKKIESFLVNGSCALRIEAKRRDLNAGTEKCFVRKAKHEVEKDFNRQWFCLR